MTPDQICNYLEQNFPELTSQPRLNPDGWSFSLGTPINGVNSNRIIRAVRPGPDSPTKLKLAITSRLFGEKILDFTGNQAELKQFIDQEIALYRKNFTS